MASDFRKSLSLAELASVLLICTLWAGCSLGITFGIGDLVNHYCLGFPWSNYVLAFVMGAFVWVPLLFVILVAFWLIHCSYQERLYELEQKKRLRI